MKYRNYNTRTEALRQLKELGECILLFPYNEGAFQQESTSIKAASIRQGMKVELKSALLVVEGELPQRVLRVKKVV
ncbi:TPA: hypothetical protein QFT03_000853 [Kluyvera ascorbata]|nr:hypothetical protein [Kluyvera ascorbata]